MGDLFTVPSVPLTVQRLTALLRGYRLPIGSERAFQDALQAIFDRHGIVHQREYDLGGAGTIDFFLPDGRIGIELKVQGSPAEVLRQLHRYALSQEIEALVLVTGRSRLGHLPSMLAGKPIAAVSVWEACL